MPCTLVTNIEKALNDVGDSKYTVILDELKNKITICSDLSGGDHIFSLDFYGCSEPHDCRTRAVYPPRSIGRIIGFPRENFLYASGKAKFTTGSGIVIGNRPILLIVKEFLLLLLHRFLILLLLLLKLFHAYWKLYKLPDFFFFQFP